MMYKVQNTIKYKKGILIFGMHRSGTSALSGIFHNLGFPFGKELLPPNNFNLKGYFENVKVVKLNDNILMHYKRNWHSFSFFNDIIAASDVEEFEKDIQNLLNQEFEDEALFVIKDPRLSLLLPFWKPTFKKNKINLSCVILIRHPLEVAKSLKKRDNFPIEKSLILWMNYLLLAELYSRGETRLFVDFNQLLEAPSEIIEMISTKFDYTQKTSSKTNLYLHNNFIDKDLRHFYERKNPDLPNLIKCLYDVLLEMSKGKENDSSLLSKIDEIRERFSLWQKLFLKAETTLALKQHNNKELFIQLFINTGLGFSEQESLTVSITDRDFQVKFDLSKYSNIESLRLDPINTFAHLSIEELYFIGEHNKKQEITTNRNNAFHADDGTLYFDNIDPQIYISINSHKDKLKHLVVSVKLHAIDKNTIELISNIRKENIKENHRDIKKLKKELQERDKTLEIKDELIKQVKFNYEYQNELFEQQSQLIKLKGTSIKNIKEQSELISAGLKMQIELKEEKLENYKLQLKTLQHKIESNNLEGNEIKVKQREVDALKLELVNSKKEQQRVVREQQTKVEEQQRVDREQQTKIEEQQRLVREQQTKIEQQQRLDKEQQTKIKEQEFQWNQLKQELQTETYKVKTYQDELRLVELKQEKWKQTHKANIKEQQSILRNKEETLIIQEQNLEKLSNDLMSKIKVIERLQLQIREYEKLYSQIINKSH